MSVRFILFFCSLSFLLINYYHANGELRTKEKHFVCYKTRIKFDCTEDSENHDLTSSAHLRLNSDNWPVTGQSLVQRVDITIHWITQLILIALNRCLVIYSVDSDSHPLNIDSLFE